MDPQVRLLLRILDQAFEQKAWHGPNLRGSLRGVSARDAARRPGAGRHSIREIVVHAAYWKYAVTRRLTGGARGSCPVEGSNWFVRPARDGERGWHSDVQLLVQQHRALRKVVAGLKDKDLGRKSGSGTYDRAPLVYGIASHDLYHAGQIQLLKRLLKIR